MKQNIHISVNHEVLVWARETLALNRANVCEKTKISSNRLIQLEDGSKQPTLEELKELSKLYKRTIATLLLNKPPKEKPLPIDRRTINSSEIGHFHEKTILAIRKSRALVGSLIELKRDANLNIPKFNFSANLNDDTSKIAFKVREFLNLNEIRTIENNSIALEGYIEKVESLGIAIFQLSLKQDGLRGFSIIDEEMPIIGIKRGGEQATSKIFTLFHELAHIILNEGGLCDLSENTTQKIEKWCNSFAGEILVPRSELLNIQLVLDKKSKADKIWTKKDLVEIGNRFHVGPLAILRTLLELKLTSNAYYNDRHKAWNKPSFGKSKNPEGRNLAKEAIAEKGRSYTKLAFTAFDQNRIDIKDLSDFLGLKISYIPRTRQLLNL